MPCEQKNYILEHVLYEMQIYLYTINNIKNKLCVVQMYYNINWISQLTSLRNLLHFFSNNKKNKTDIIYTDILDGINTLDIYIENSQIVKLINKSTSHLTFDRVSDLSEKEATAVEAMKKLIPTIISDFINALPTNINTKYASELEVPAIKGIIEYIKELLIELNSYDLEA